jgi:hypothetical protein
MKSKAPAIHLIPEIAENWANRCQLSGHPYPAFFGLLILLLVIAG